MGGFHGGHDSGGSSGFHGGHSGSSGGSNSYSGGSSSGQNGGYYHPNTEYSGGNTELPEDYYEPYVIFSLILLGFGVAMLALAGSYYQWNVFMILFIAVPFFAGGFVLGGIAVKKILKRRKVKLELYEHEIMPKPESLTLKIIITLFITFAFMLSLILYIENLKYSSEPKEKQTSLIVMGIFGFLFVILIYFLVQGILSNVRYKKYLKDGGITEEEYFKNHKE